jgi:pimeloyl-ACP methyl ester carboxylesterase
LPACRVNGININYRVQGEGLPLVLIHQFTSSLEMWASLMQELPPGYQIIVYDVRGHGLSSAPAGAGNYTLEKLVEDLHGLLTYLNVKQAIIGGLSLGGAIALGYSKLYPEMLKALLILDIHGGFQPLPDKSTLESMTRMWDADEKYALEWGMADLARRKIETGTVWPPILQDKTLQELYIRQMAGMSVNGFIGVGQAKPWEAEWQRRAAENVKVPTLITVGDQDMIKPGVKLLHEHIKGSRYVEIKGAFHGTSQWCPKAFNRSVIDFLKAVELNLPVEGEITLDQNANIC